MAQPMAIAGGPGPYQRRGFALIRRWVFGIILVLMGLLGVLSDVFDTAFFETYVGALTAGTVVGGIVLILIGLVYFVAAFSRTRSMTVASF